MADSKIVGSGFFSNSSFLQSVLICPYFIASMLSMLFSLIRAFAWVWSNSTQACSLWTTGKTSNTHETRGMTLTFYTPPLAQSTLKDSHYSFVFICANFILHFTYHFILFMFQYLHFFLTLSTETILLLPLKPYYFCLFHFHYPISCLPVILDSWWKSYRTPSHTYTLIHPNQKGLHR